MREELPFEKIEREIFVRRDFKSDPKFGMDPNKRPIEEHLQYGIVNIDKPKGPTSHQVSAYVQKIFKIDKAGHSGTLDPKVTGVLPVALNKVTKVVQALLPAGKEYVCVMHLHDDYEEEKIREVCESFIGRIKQMPPLKSAIKRQERYRKIYYFNVLEIKGRDVLFQVGCQAGTYIRKLAHDIGVKLGTGAHMAELRRTKAGPFNESTLCSLQDVTDAVWRYKEKGDESLLRKYVQPVEKAIEHLPKVWILDSSVSTIAHGANLKVPGVTRVHSDIQVDELIAIMTEKGELVAFGKAKMISKDMIKEERGIAVILERVFMERDVYPKIEKSS